MRELKVALIGAGFMGRAHSLAYAIAPIAGETGSMVVKEVLVDVPAARAEQLSNELGWSSWSDDWRAVIARDDIDIVDICTPPQFHREIAEAAMRAGKHVFCEKPISNDAGEARELAEIAATTGVVNQVGFNYRHTPAVAQVRHLLDEGVLGSPLQFRGSYLQDVGFGADPNRWRASRSTGGSGTVGDIGSHLIDIAQYLVGDIVSVAARMRSVSAAQTGLRSEAERMSEDLIDDIGVWSAEFAGGSVGTFAVSSFASGRSNLLSFALDATRGAVDFDWNHREELRISRVDAPADERGFRTVYTNDQHPNGWWRLAGLGTGYVEVSAVQFQQFLRRIDGQDVTVPDFAAAAQVEAVVDAIARASETAEWVDVSPRPVRAAEGARARA